MTILDALIGIGFNKIGTDLIGESGNQKKMKHAHVN